MSGEEAVGLRRDAVGLREVLFQSVTAMAPAAAVAASVPAGAVFAGGSLPLAVVIALVACLFTASCVAELARELPAAGSVATYAAQGLHPAVGFLVGWGYVFVEALVPPLLLLQLGFTAAGTLHDEWASCPADLWWPWALAGAAVIAVTGYLGVRASARFGTVLGVFEIAVFLVFAGWLIVRAGGHNTLSVFGTSHTARGHPGVSGVFAGCVYTVLAFAGFEAAAPLAEETRDPRRTMHRAVLGAALGIGLFYVVTTYAMAVYFGPDRFASFGAAGDASWEGVARASFGLFWVLVFLAVVNSTIANANACANVSTRTAFALARIRVLPRVLATLHPRYRSPVAGIAVQTAVAVGAVLGLGFGYDPVTAFLLLATVRDGRHRRLHRRQPRLRRLLPSSRPTVPQARTAPALPAAGHRGLRPRPAHRGRSARLRLRDEADRAGVVRRFGGRRLDGGRSGRPAGADPASPRAHSRDRARPPRREHPWHGRPTERSNSAMTDPRILTVRPGPDDYAWTFGGAPPVARIAPGTVLDLYTEDCFAGRVRSEKDLVSEVCEFPFLNPQTGPFHIEGAEPGDTVAVHFVSVEPARDWAASTTVPLFGALTSTHSTATLQPPLPETVWIWQLDRTRRTALFRAREGGIELELPLDPMHGTVGVAPANLEVRSALVPDAHGGNMDTPEMRAGVTCYLGVNVEGALLSLGDGHARQGEGETCGVAVECATATSALSGPRRAVSRL